MLSAVKGFARLFLLFLVIHSLLVEFFSSRYGAQKEPSRPKKPEVQKAKPYDPFARFLQSAFWYQALVQAGGRKPRDHFVRLVTLVRNREPEEIFQDICSQRLFMAKLILKLKISQSAVIVIDKFFPVHSCPDPMNEGNRLLGQALQDSDVPIVLGLRTSDPDELAAQRPLDANEILALHKATLVLEPFMQFGAEHHIKYGLIRGDRDSRKIPLEWPVFDTRDDLSANREPHNLPTLSRVAAEEYDPMTFARPELQRLVAKHVHPFTSFLRESEILTYSAIQLVCDPSILQPSRWEDCTAGAVGNDAFRNHIVVIGNRTADDFHPSVIGTVPGVVLQANYIESLLDGRYFTPVPFWPAFLVNLALSLGIGWLFYRFSFLGGGSRNLTVLRSFVFIFGGWILSYFLALQLGYYLVIWFPGGALVALWARKRRLKNPEAPKVREAGI